MPIRLERALRGRGAADIARGLTHSTTFAARAVGSVLWGLCCGRLQANGVAFAPIANISRKVLPQMKEDLFPTLSNEVPPLGQFCVPSNTGNLTGHVDASASSIVRDIAAAATYRIKLRYKKGTGSNEELEVWANFEASGTWGTSQIRTNGTNTTRADSVVLTNTNTGNHDITLDTGSCFYL
jgi:hypothetical protein